MPPPQVNQEDVDKVAGMFDALDEDGSGQLDVEDIRAARRGGSKPGSAGRGAAVAPAKEAGASSSAPARNAEEAMARGSWLSALTKPLLGQ